MAKPRDRSDRIVRDGGADRGPINRMVGSPEPSLDYAEGVSQRWWRWAWPVVVAVLALYFLYGP